MLHVRIRRVLVTLAAAAMAVAGIQLASAATAQADPAPNMATVYYTAYGYQSQSNQAAQIWNNAVPNLNMVSSSNGSIVIYATTGGGSRAYPCGLGCATIYIDSQDVAAGHNALRIVSHEIGHGHRLPDNYNGNCAILMSGGSAGTSCSNPNPSAGEAATVNSYYGGFWSAADSEPVTSGVYDPSLVTVSR
ncbi:snapalysin [Stackebrandtia endophytica]|uniref:Extracellular small neutral protease n=1 Tax=Stackebrandtia endophytica TaxID=1496996 RepID=A0A543B186_9ACTN|nr:snapalysin family zinc-dependent metalloprotease [Stackebrandtia endophytica]TQL78593.1 snapalysin [Stackebrandtia endophytica]